MKKLPCLFQRDFIPRAKDRGSDAVIRPDVTPGLEWVLEGQGIATRKWDGTACAVIRKDVNGARMSWAPMGLWSQNVLYRRYDAKHGKPAPADGIPCDDPDPVTGHWPHWIPVGKEPESKYMRAAYCELERPLEPGTYEFCGPHLQGNPQRLEKDMFVPHGKHELEGADLGKFEALKARGRTFEQIQNFLRERMDIEGIVFWKDGEPRCKIRRKDFGFAWPVKEG